MSNDATVTIVGNVTADPELRFTQSGLAVANLTVASTPRSFNRSTQEWEDGETLFLRCTVWREYAENVAESLLKGHRVVVTGRLRQRSFTSNEGEERTVIECDIDEIGPVLRYHTATIEKVSREEAKPAAKSKAKTTTTRRTRTLRAATTPDEPPF